MLQRLSSQTETWLQPLLRQWLRMNPLLLCSDSNACSGAPGEVPDNEVNAHLGNPAYIHIPVHGWWYAVTVINYYSRYLLACYLTDSYSTLEVAQGLKLARAEAGRVHGPQSKRPSLVTDKGPSFLAWRFRGFMHGPCSH